MTLMTLLRLTGLLALGWTVIALGAGALGVGAHDVPVHTFYSPAPSLQDAVAMVQPESPTQLEYRLLDRTTGRTEPLALPQEEAWSLLSVSPWRDRAGNLEAVGRWVSRLDGDEYSWGLGLLTLPGSTVVNRLALDVLPIGKPCWVPGRPGEVLFPAGDGQLYLCNIAGDARENKARHTSRTPDRDGGNLAPSRRLTWQRQPPGSSIAFFFDPVCSSEPALRNLVFVAASIPKVLDKRKVNLPSKLWWLAMEGDEIVAAGRLTRPTPNDPVDEKVCERMPNVVIGAGGKISVVYLSRQPNKKTWALRSAPVDLEPETRQPRIHPSLEEPEVLTEGLILSSLVVSADGHHVYGLEASGTQFERSLPR